MNDVSVWQEEVIIPTYEVGEPEKYPMFFEKRVYQGSSGVVYPNAIIEKIGDEKVDKLWKAVFLENDFIKIMILPQLGGRVQMAYDKIAERHFIYYNSVIKPALVGLTGPWISGGIEFNWPQHHRPSTFEEVDYTIEEHEEGSKTVWVNEIEKMFRTKGMAGFRVYPDKACLEINVKLYNRTPQPQTFLWWANPAVKVNDHYQSVFPPDVHAVFDHGKRDVSEFPIARGTYYKVDYSAGVDISRYKNIPVPTSYMAVQSKYDFMGGYEHDTEGGLLHVANHHISPGKKQWTWGNGEFGKAWDRNLTDKDGPYIELMTGVFTDNQPDFSWLNPYEEKCFTQYFLPYRKLGMVKNANKDFIINLEYENDKVLFKLMSTGYHDDVHITIHSNQSEYINLTRNVSPTETVSYGFDLADMSMFFGLQVSIFYGNGDLAFQYQPERPKHQTPPEPAKEALLPSEIPTNEELFLTGQHLEQYRHATYRPESYYVEALKRDKNDFQNNLAYGKYLLSKGQFHQSTEYLDRAVSKVLWKNPNPYNGEAFYYHGLAMKHLQHFDHAKELFYKASWNHGVQDAAYFELAKLATRFGNFQEAIQLVKQSLVRNASNHKALHLLIIVHQKLGQNDIALSLIEDGLQNDKFNVGLYLEQECILKEHHKLDEAKAVREYFLNLMRNSENNFLELSLDYADAGFFKEAIEIIDLFILENKTGYSSLPHYYKSYFLDLLGDHELAHNALELAKKNSAKQVFPNKLEEIKILTHAIDNDKDAHAHYMLGNLWYDKRQYDLAITNWNSALTIDADHAASYRNLSLALYNKKKQHETALKYMEKAFLLDPESSRVFMELDQLRKKMNVSLTERKTHMDAHFRLVRQRDDQYLEYITVLNLLGEEEEALALLQKRKFHPWEGGEGKVSGQYVFSQIELAKKNIECGNYQIALNHLEKAQAYPENLGEGKLSGQQENDIFFFMGLCHEQMGQNDLAQFYYHKASTGDIEPNLAVYYNDQSPDQILYYGLALLKLGQEKEGHKIFKNLEEYAVLHENDEVKIDYFAVSLPDMLIFDADLNKQNRLHCLYMKALSHIGQGKMHKAIETLNDILKDSSAHQGAIQHLKLLSAYQFLLPVSSAYNF